VYCSEFISDDEAASLLLAGSMGPRAPRRVRCVSSPAGARMLEEELRRDRTRQRVPRAAGIHQHPPDPDRDRQAAVPVAA
jgi:hypothetical protein